MGTNEAEWLAIGEEPVEGGLPLADQLGDILYQQRQGDVKGVAAGLGGDLEAEGLPEVGQQEHDGDLLQDERELTAPPVVQAEQVFEGQESQFNGLITNDKFCMSRTARLQLSHWRLPRSARQTSRAGVESPVTGNTEEYLPQQEAYEETTMERSASLRGTA
jgi:hypothetical protein